MHAIRCYGHAGAVILLGGWVLLFPRCGQDACRKAPLRDWVPTTAFDTAKECEQARQEDARVAGRPLDDVARCVPAEFAYPSRGPAQK